MDITAEVRRLLRELIALKKEAIDSSRQQMAIHKAIRQLEKAIPAILRYKI